jgi:hypothetical protein
MKKKKKQKVIKKPTKRQPKEDFNQAAFRVVRESTS